MTINLMAFISGYLWLSLAISLSTSLCRALLPQTDQYFLDVCKLTESALNVPVKVIATDTEQGRPQLRALGSTTADRTLDVTPLTTLSGSSPPATLPSKQCSCPSHRLTASPAECCGRQRPRLC